MHPLAEGRNDTGTGCGGPYIGQPEFGYTKAARRPLDGEYWIGLVAGLFGQQLLIGDRQSPADSPGLLMVALGRKIGPEEPVIG